MAIAHALAEKTRNVVFLDRVIDGLRIDAFKAVISALRINQVDVLELNDQNIRRYMTESNIVINSTPVGMYPMTNNSVVSAQHFRDVDMISPIADKPFFGAVLNPPLSQMLTLVHQEYGASVCSGLHMMIYQGLEAFKLWTGKTVSEDKHPETYSMLMDIFSNPEGLRTLIVTALRGRPTMQFPEITQQVGELKGCQVADMAIEYHLKALVRESRVESVRQGTYKLRMMT